MSKGLNELRDEAHANSKAKGFHDTPRSVAEDIALMHSELSEALEDYRAGHQPFEVWYEGDHVLRLKPCGIPSEIADVIIRALDFCGAHGIDIERVVAEKMAFNATRPHKHGKKL